MLIALSNSPEAASFIYEHSPSIVPVGCRFLGVELEVKSTCFGLQGVVKWRNQVDFGLSTSSFDSS